LLNRDLPKWNPKEGLKLKNFIASLPPFEDQDTSFDLKWNLSDLENIVYDFVNGCTLPKEFKTQLHDVEKEDLMLVTRVGKNSAESKQLPQIVREYILHDRGNSLYLGNSFENLPSPVHESPTIKKIFKRREDDEGIRLEK